MKTIKVFIASSEELGQERLEIGDLFAHLNSIFKRRGIVLEVSKWEYLDESMGSLRKQDEYNREIKTCDMCMVLYWKRLGEFTCEELETAYTELQAGRKPYRLYIYFKEVGEMTQEMKSFKDRFYPKYGHFYGKFENSDTLKLRFLLQLEGYISSGAVKVENSQIMVDTIPVASLDNIPFAAQNAHYKDLKERLAKIEDDIKAFESVLAVQANETIRDRLNTKKSERHKLQEELSSHEQSLFNTAVRVAKFAGEKISERMQRAIALFEEGKVAEANTLLDDAECEADAALSRYKQTKELLASERETLIRSIKELLLKTSVMLADTSIAAEERVSRTAEIYEKASSLARECDYDKEKFAKLLEKKSDFLIKHALYSEAQVVNDEWLSLCKEHLGEKHVSTAASYNNIGVAYYSLGDYDKALEYYDKALGIRLDVLGENHPDVAASYSNIGVAYYSLGDYDKALEYYNKALGIQLNVLGENHSGVATSYSNIGVAYYSLGDYDKALEYHNKAHDIRLDVLGENHPDVAASYNNIGMAYYSLGDYDKALEYHNKALGIQLNVLGENHPGVAASYNNIGMAYYSLGDYDKALEYHNKALGIQLNVLSENHPGVAGSYSNIGLAYYSLGDYDKALEYHNKAHDIRLDVLGENHPDVAASYNNIGMAYDSLGDYDKALEYHNKAHDIRLDVLGENHPGVAASYSNIGLAYYSLGDYDKALEYFDKTLGIQLNVLGENHPDVATTLDCLVFLYSETQQFLKAYKTAEDALNIRKRLYEESALANEKQYIEALISMSFYSLMIGKFDEAETYSIEAIGIDSTEIVINTNLAAALLLQGKNEEAERIYSLYKADLKESFLDDFRQLDEAGIIPKERKVEVEKIKRMLNEE